MKYSDVLKCVATYLREHSFIMSVIKRQRVAPKCSCINTFGVKFLTQSDDTDGDDKVVFARHMHAGVNEVEE